MSGGDQAADVNLGHAVMQGTIDGFIGGEGYVVSKLHQRKLGWTLDHATPSSDRSCAHEPGLGRCLFDAVAEYESDRFLNPDFSSENAAVFETLCQTLIRALVFLPGANVGLATLRGGSDLLAGPPFFECRADVERGALGRQNHREHSFPTPPANAGEVVQRSSLHKQRWHRDHLLPS